MVSSEPVSEALLPVYNQLQTLKRCLIEVKNSGGVSSPRELYPYSMKVRSGLHVSYNMLLILIFYSSIQLIICGKMESSCWERRYQKAKAVLTSFWQSVLSSATSSGWLLSRRIAIHREYQAITRLSQANLWALRGGWPFCWNRPYSLS